MERLPPPHKLTYREWTYDKIRDAVEKSRAAALFNLRSSISTSTSTHDVDLINLPNVENLFLVDTTDFDQEERWLIQTSFGEDEKWEWGSRDMMFDFRHDDDDNDDNGFHG